MRLEKVQEALKTKKIHYEYTEENGCGSIDFMFRGLRFHIWEYEDRVWGAETNVFEAGRSRILREIRGNYFRRNPLMAGYAAWDVSMLLFTATHSRELRYVKSNVSITAEGNDIYEKI